MSESLHVSTTLVLPSPSLRPGGKNSTNLPREAASAFASGLAPVYQLHQILVSDIFLSRASHERAGLSVQEQTAFCMKLKPLQQRIRRLAAYQVWKDLLTLVLSATGPNLQGQAVARLFNSEDVGSFSLSRS